MCSESKSFFNILFLGLFAWTVSPLSAQGQSATRHLPDFIIPSGTLPVSITIETPPETISVGLQDAPPAGWTVSISSISPGGSYDSENHEVKWPFLFAPFPAAVSYDVTPPVQVACENCFVGSVSFNGLNNQDIGGDQCIATDCNENGVPDVCDIRDDTSDDLNGNGIPDECECKVDLDCDDGDVCTHDECVGGVVCRRTPNTYGDVDHDGFIDIFDLFCILQGFDGDFSACSFQDVDIEPCLGNGEIDVFDLFAVLNAFSGIDPCCGG